MTEQSQRAPDDLKESGYATQELAMAAYLSLNGYMYDLRRDGESSTGRPFGSWSFKDRDGELGEAVKKFNDGDARVEPDRFLKEVNNVRKAMFRFLGVTRAN